MISNLMRFTFFCAIFFLFLAFTSSRKFISSAREEGDTISRSKFNFERQLPPSGSSPTEGISFPRSFTAVEGVTTFRGGPYRDRPSVGALNSSPKFLKIKWSYTTKGDPKWGGGAGWTGQPLIIKWSDSVRAMMNVLPEFKSKSNFKEVILGALDGRIYFHDLETGKPSRPPIDIRNPIKGTLTVDPRGLPILYAGQGISNTGEFGVRIFSLIDQSKIFFLNGHDTFALRSWAAFDSSPLIDGQADAMFVGGENGLVYSVGLHTKLIKSPPAVSVAPQVTKYRYKLNASQLQGIESTLVGYRNVLYFCDNNGFIQCVSANDMKPIWIAHNKDDTDATLVLEEESGVPFLYTGNEVDIQGAKGFTVVKKLNGHDGSTVWESIYECRTVRGAHPVNGGMLSTPVVGKQNGKDLAVFSISRYKGMDRGLLVALKKSTGEKAWEVLLEKYAWSSPLDIYDKQGNMYIFLADSGGSVMLFDGQTGALIFKEKIGDLFEASPVAYDNLIVIPSRPRSVFCLEVQ
jgi:outer membrane protein assembly factor BamB